MTTGSTPPDFNSAAIQNALLGTWNYPRTEEPTGIGLIHFTDTGRAIQFVFDPHRPEKRIPLRLWFSVESPTHLRFRPRLDYEGWLHGYRFDGSAVTFGVEGRSWICTRPAPDDIPDWFHQALASEVARP